MHELQYDGPATVREAIALLGRGHARVLAGGTDLIPQMREGRRTVAQIIDLKRIPELTEITRRAGGSWRIGAAASIGSLGRHAGFAAEHSALLESARLVGSLQVQSRASLGGNLCNAAPSADAVPLLFSLGALARIVGAGGERTVPVDAIPTGPGRTSLKADEVLVSLDLAARKNRWAAKYLRFTPRREMDIAVAGAGVLVEIDDKGRIADARITLASVGPVPIAAEAASQVLVGAAPAQTLFAAAGDAAAREARPISDTRGSADYRRELVAVLTRRALAACVEQLGISLQ